MDNQQIRLATSVNMTEHELLRYWVNDLRSGLDKRPDGDVVDGFYGYLAAVGLRIVDDREVDERG